MQDSATSTLEAKLQDTHGGVAQQNPFRLPDSLPTGVPHTCYDDVEPRQYLGPRGVHRVMENKDGLHLQSYFWPAAEAKAVVLFVHGHGAHLMFEILNQTGLGKPMCYEGSWAEQWNQRGISMCGLDLQSCGRSEGKRGLRFYIDSFDDYVEDVLQLARSVHAGGTGAGVGIPGFQPGLPLFIAGISLGGCIAFHAILRTQEQEPPLFRGAALLAPMLSLEKVSRKGLNPYIRPIANLLSWLAPTAAIVATEKNVLYPDIQAQWDHDPLACHTNTRVRCASEFLRITEHSMQRLGEVAFPFILFHSENDTMVDVDGSKELYQQAQSKDKMLRLCNDMWHILVREKGNEKICAALADWMLERATPTAA